MLVGGACSERSLSSGEEGLSVRSALSFLRISGCLVRGRGASRRVGPDPPAPRSIQYDQICRGLVLAALLETTPTLVLLKNKPVATDL